MTTDARPITLLAFKSPSCPPCRALAPVLERLAERYRGRVDVRVVDTHEDIATADAYHVRSVPTLIALAGGEVLEQQVGYAGPGRVEAMFERVCGAATRL